MVAVRTLAENDAAQAYEAAHRLERMQPPEAQAQDKVRMLNLLARIEVYLALIEAADRHAMQARQLALQTGDTIGQVEADLNVAINAINQGHIEDSMVATIRGVELLKGTARHDLLGEAMLRMSMMYRRLGQFDSSVEVTMQAMEVAKQSNDPWALMYAYQGLAISYDQSGRYPEARDYYLRMREAARQARSRLQEAHAVRGLAGVVASLGNTADAERLYREAIAMFRQTHAPFSLNFGLSGLAAMLDRHGRYAEAVELMDEVMANYTAYPNPIGAWFALNLRSTVLEHVGRQGDARRDAEHAYVLANRIGQPLYLSGSAKRLSELAAARGDFRQAYQLAKQAADQADKSAQSKAGTLMLQLAQRFEIETKQRKIDELKSRNALQEAELQRNVMQQRWLWTSLFAGVALLLAGLLFVQRLRRSRAEIGALNAGLEQRVEARTAELRLSQRSLAEAQRIAHLGSWEMDLVENVLSWSDEIYRIFEIDPAAFGASYEAFMEMVHPDDRALLDRTYKEALERHQPYEIEHRLLLPDGRVKFVHERGETLYDTEGKPLRTIGTVQDVTERRSVESKLRDALAFSEGVINAIPDILIEVGRDGRYLNVWTQNPELLAAQKEQLLGKILAEVLSPENAAAAMRAIREAEVQGASRIEDICIDLPVGKRWFSHSLSRKPGNTPGENTFLVLSRDITERKQLEEALAARERELRALAESSPGMMGSFYLKPDGTVCMPYVSPNVYALFGVRPEEIKEDATPLLRLNHPDDAQRVMDTIAESARTLEPWHCEFRIEHPHKGERWMEGHTNPSSHPDGGTVWYGYIHDITERKRLESQLVASRNFLDGVIESVSDPIFVKDRQHRWTLLNEAFCSFIGHARESLLGKSDYDFFPESEADEFWAKDEAVFGSGQGNLNEEDFTSADGETHFIQTKKTPFRAADGSQMLVGVIHDITERKRFETAREAALTEARRLAKARSDFIAHMSHELRTPLNTILGYAQILERDAGLDARQHEEVGMIRASGEHLLALIEDILDLARIEAGKFTLDLGDVSLPHLLDFVAGVTALRAKQKGIAFVCEFAADLPSGVRGDEKRLRQVLLNLLANAVKFTDHGQVMLDVRRIGMDRLAFVVEDTGIGIPSADIETIFQPFEQSQAVGHREGGTGLGLAICRQLVRLMGGEIYVESRVGVGSRFSFELSLPALDIGLLQPVAGLDEAIDAPPLIAPSAEMMQALLRCARLGNMRDILVEAERIAALGPAYHPFAAHIKRLAEGFQSKALLAFVERYMI